MQYHQIVIFTHRPWVSKRYIQPRSPRQGPGYHHARKMCIDSSMAVAKLLQIYEKHYTFRRMNNQVVAIIFSAALMLLYFTISSGGKGNENGNNSAEMVAYLNLCFRALDELGQSFDNAKRTRDFLVSLQRRWQAHMRRSGSKRQISNRQTSQPPTSKADHSRKRSRLSAPGNPPNINNNNSLPFSTSPPSVTGTAAAIPPPATTPSQQPPILIPQRQQQPLNQPHLTTTCHAGEIDWIRNSDLHLLSDGLTDTQFPQLGAAASANANTNANAAGAEAEASTIPSLADIEPWWDSPNGTTSFGGSL